MPSEVNVAKETNSPWGFQLTGGAKFGMPLTVFEVQEGGRADKAGIRLGDVLVKINGMETNELSLEQARDIINKAGNNINLAVSNLEDQGYSDSDDYHEASKSIEESMGISESETSAAHALEREKSAEILSSAVSDDESSLIKEEESIENVNALSQDEGNDDVKKTIDLIAALKELEAEEEQPRVDVNTLPLLPPRPAPAPEIAQRKSWHPVMLDTNPPPVIEEKSGNEEAPHKKLMRDLRQAISMKKIQASPEMEPEKIETEIEAETVTESEPELSVEDQLRVMQQQLKALTRLPATMQATLAAVTAKIDGLLPAEGELSTIPLETPVDTEASDADNDPATEDSADILGERPESTDIQTEEDISLKEPFLEPEEVTEPTPDEIEKNERLAKLATLNKSWPWADGNKAIYKIAEHYKVPYSNFISSRVKILEHKIPIKRL